MAGLLCGLSASVVNLAGERFLRLLPDLLAELRVNIHGLVEFLFESPDGVPLKRDHVPRIDNLTMQDLRFLIKGNFGYVSLIWLIRF
jgi:hypothetical protein